MDSKRLEWIDCAKGFGILLVLLGHCGLSIGGVIYLFHMPLFYVISGFLWNTEKYQAMPRKDFFLRKFQSYIIPYLKISLVCFFFFGVIEGLYEKGLSISYIQQLSKYLFGIFIYSRGTKEWLPNCSPIWFLTALFFAELIYYEIRRNKNVLLSVLVIGILGYVLSFIGKYFPWNIDNAFTAVPFLYIGTIFRKYWNMVSMKSNIIILLPLSMLAFSCYRFKVDFDGNTFDLYPVTAIASIIIVTTLLSVMNRIRRGGQITRYFGKNTLILLGYNYAINMIVSIIFPRYMGTWFQIIPVILLGILLIYVVNKYKIIKKILI